MAGWKGTGAQDAIAHSQPQAVQGVNHDLHTGAAPRDGAPAHNGRHFRRERAYRACISAGSRYILTPSNEKSHEGTEGHDELVDPGRSGAIPQDGQVHALRLCPQRRSGQACRLSHIPMGFEAIEEVLMPTRIAPRGERIASRHPADVSRIMGGVRRVPLASYREKKRKFRVSCGSI